MARPKKTTVEKKTQATAAPAKAAVSVAEGKESEAEVTEAKAEEVKAEEPAQPATAKKEEKTVTRKTPVKRQAKKAPVEIVEEVYVEYNHEQFMAGDIVNRIKETYKSEGHRISSIKSLKVYVDPVQRKAYYVINEKAEGKSVDL